MNKILSSKEKLWADRISLFQESGLSRKEWCHQNEIPLSTFSYWNRKLQSESAVIEESNNPVFAKLPSEQDLCPGERIGKSSIIIHLSEDIRIEVGPDCPDRLMATLLRALKAYA